MAEHDVRCHEIQELKFGQLIDLEMIDKVKCVMLRRMHAPNTLLTAGSLLPKVSSR